MPFYIIDTNLPRPGAPANLDTGGMSAWVHGQPYATREAAERALQRLLLERTQGWQQFLERVRHGREKSIGRFPGSSTVPERTMEPLPQRDSTQETTIVAAADTKEALQLAEAEAYRRLGLPVPSIYQYFAVAMRSVSRGKELQDKQVEVIAGPSASRGELGDVSENAMIGGTLQAVPNATRDSEKADSLSANGSASRTYVIKAVDLQHALRGEGIGVSAIIPPQGARRIAP